MKKHFFTISIVLLLSNNPVIWSQVNPEDVALDKNEFEEAYYESIIQKSIENYDKAIVELQKCLKFQPENAIIHNELGRNYYFKKDFLNAETAFKKAISIDSKNKWYLIGLYDIYYNTKNYTQAVLIAQQIVPLDKNYKEDVVSLYMYTQQYDKALVLINELEQNEGRTEMRDRYKREINAQSKTNATGKNELEKIIENSPLLEENYLTLISLYSENNQEEKAKLTAEKLEKNIPNSEWAQVFLYKYHINENKFDIAFKSIETVLKGTKIDAKIKFKMFNEFLIATAKNPVLEPQLNKIASYFENDVNFDVFAAIGKFYFKKKQYDLAIKNLEKSVATDLESNTILLTSYEEILNFESLHKKASDLVDTFPNQPEYYFWAGKSCNKLKNFKKAIPFLESGMDYVIDNKTLDVALLTQLTEAYKGIGNMKKAEEFLAKANQLKNKK